MSILVQKKKNAKPRIFYSPYPSAICLRDIFQNRSFQRCRVALLAMDSEQQAPGHRVCMCVRFSPNEQTITIYDKCYISILWKRLLF